MVFAFQIIDELVFRVVAAWRAFQTFALQIELTAELAIVPNPFPRRAVFIDGDSNLTEGGVVRVPDTRRQETFFGFDPNGQVTNSFHFQFESLLH